MDPVSEGRIIRLARFGFDLNTDIEQRPVVPNLNPIFGHPASAADGVLDRGWKYIDSADCHHVVDSPENASQ